MQTLEKMQDARFMSADQKRLVLKAWIRFLASGLSRDKFTKALYSHLIGHCEFIAHYDLGGFYATYFLNGDSIVQFLSQFDARSVPLGLAPPSAEYGDASWANFAEYGDVNRAMVRVAKSYIPGLIENARESQRFADVSSAKRLLEKHGYQVSMGA